ncbi:stage 0 sporulation family protein [bacterium]|nr:stage 0 sporulation family protein [bacterium]MBU1154038.1 stage 0 sporulation family protein [bacterium]MBU1782250.1 stage 0 sporulation family protein [bacterium]MBU2599758.1 stage 0 sporulation family protein [bacterium]
MNNIVEIKFSHEEKTCPCFNPNLDLKRGTVCIVETEREINYGEVVAIAGITDEIASLKPSFKIIRIANDADLKQIKKNEEKAKEILKLCLKKIQNRGLPMKIVKVYLNFDKSKINLYFTANTRIDFRELAKDLAYTYKARIEFHQIGVRDEAKVFGGFGWCGRKLCCASFLTNFNSVSIKMAKEQNLILTPSKISGVCGRLMCCLAFECETYSKLKKNMPSKGTVVSTPKGKGKITAVNPIKNSVYVRLAESDQEVETLVKDIKIIDGDK